MRCPKCGGPDDKVIDSRSSREGRAIRRRRVCLQCGHRYTTYEQIERSELVVIKRDGRREVFSREKLMGGLQKACEKRPISHEEISDLVERISEELVNAYDREVPVMAIGERVMAALRSLDKVAYVRYASVYRRFEEADEFVEVVTKLEKERYDTATLRLPGL
jgi:transcriptional repressor NrdR